MVHVLNHLSSRGWDSLTLSHKSRSPQTLFLTVSIIKVSAAFTTNEKVGRNGKDFHVDNLQAFTSLLMKMFVLSQNFSGLKILYKNHITLCPLNIDLVTVNDQL